MLSRSQDVQIIRATLARRLAEVYLRISDACTRAGRLADSVRLIAVTKTATPEQIRAIASLGVLDLGENRVQVLESHIAATEDLADVRWHMIGHLQRNKVKQLLPLVTMIQSVDSLRLATEIESCAAKAGRRISVLIELNAGEEAQKYGMGVGEVRDMAGAIAEMPHLELRGVMSMAPLTEDTGRIRQTFMRTREVFDCIHDAGIAGDAFRELSMGMSGDFEIAIEEGATIVRVGSLLFAPGGER